MTDSKDLFKQPAYELYRPLVHPPELLGVEAEAEAAVADAPAEQVAVGEGCLLRRDRVLGDCSCIT